MSKVKIIKYLDGDKVVEVKKSFFNDFNLPEKIIDEYEVEIKDNKLEKLIRKHTSGEYVIVISPDGKKWEKRISFTFITHYENIKLIHKKHKVILEEYLKNPSVEIECTNYISKDADMETIWYLEEDFIEHYDENIYYRLKVKDLAWYEDENIIGKLIYDGLNMEYGLVLKVRDNLIETSLDRKYSLNEINSYKLRPATKEEALNLVYKPQQKAPKEINLTESNRLKDLFLNNKAECLVENEQEFRLVYDFLDKTCDRNLNRYLELDGSFKYDKFYDEFPIVIFTLRKWENIYEWDKPEDRDLNKPLIKFNGETFWEVFE